MLQLEAGVYHPVNTEESRRREARINIKMQKRAEEKIKECRKNRIRAELSYIPHPYQNN